MYTAETLEPDSLASALVLPLPVSSWGSCVEVWMGSTNIHSTHAPSCVSRLKKPNGTPSPAPPGIWMLCRFCKQTCSHEI